MLQTVTYFDPYEKRSDVIKLSQVTTLDPALDASEIVMTLRENVELDSVLSNSFGFGGTNATLVMSKYKG